MNEYELIKELTDQLLKETAIRTKLEQQIRVLRGLFEKEDNPELTYPSIYLSDIGRVFGWERKPVRVEEPVKPEEKSEDDKIWDDLKEVAKKVEKKATGPKPKIDRAEVRKHKAEGMKAPEIAKLMGISTASAYAILKGDRED